MDDLLKNEKIKEIKGYEGVYAVTTEGRIWSIRRKIWLSYFLTGPGKKYCTVRLCFEGKVVDKKVHRLVGEAFIKNPHNKPQINHRNGDKLDNRVSNLSWATSRENMQHAGDTGLNKHIKLTFVEKILICKMKNILNVKQVDLARRFKVSSPAIRYIVKQYSNLAAAH